MIICVTGCDSANEINITDAYIKPPISGQTTAAAYLSITNNTNETISIEHIETAAASSIEIHTHIEENGMMKMRPLAKLAITPGQTIEFKPGGLHLMLFDIRELTEKQYLISFWFSNGASQTESFVVKGE